MNRAPRWLIAAFVLMLAALPTGGAWFYLTQEQHLRNEVERNLQAIAQLKVSQIVHWRAECLTDAALLMESPFLVEGIGRWLADPQTEATDNLLFRFRSLQKHHHFRDVLLLDIRGDVRLSLSGDNARIHEEAAQTLSTAFHERRPVLSEIHVGPGALPPHIDLAAPLIRGDSETSELVGAVLLQIDAGQFLYPLIQAWPTPSLSAETLLVRRDGDTVLFLNELRHQQGTALSLRIPLTRNDVPAVMAVLGKKGVVEGTDYRGAQVLSVLAAIPDSPWFMVAKIDAAEALSVWHSTSLLILALILTLAAVTAASGAVVQQRFAKAHYRALFRAEAARRESEARHRVTLMSIGDAVITTDDVGRVTLLNPVAEALTGWRLEEALGIPVTEVFRIVNEETRLPVEDPVVRVLREGVVVGLANHTTLIAGDGKEYPIADSGAPIRDEAGEITGVVLVFRDQSEERRRERALQAVTSRQQALLDAIPDIIMEVDADKIYTWANPAGLEFFGEDVIGREACHYFEGDQDTYRVVEPVFRGEEHAVYLESRQRRRDGQKRLLAWWCRVLKDDSGKVVGALSSARDITDLRQAQEEMRRLSEAIRQASEGIVITSREGAIEYVNPAFEQITGYSAEEAMGRNPRILKSGKHEKAFYRILWDTILAGNRWTERVVNKRKDGTLYTADCSISPVKNERGDLERFVWITRDISKELELEERYRQTERLESVGRLAAGVAHDMNNFLSPIFGYAEMLLQDLDPLGETYEQVGIIKQSAEHSRDLIQQLLAFGRKQVFEIKVLDLCRVVGSMEKLLRRTIREDIEIMLHLSSEACTVSADQGQVGQIVMNLAVNAQDAMPDGGALSIEVSPARLDEDYCRDHEGATPGRYVMLAVSDTGSGIDRETRQHIFEPFFTTKKDLGTGLGLATIYGIVKQHGGNIWVYSELGKGTIFKIYLPSALEERSALEAPSHSIEAMSGSETLLVVEDNEMTRNLASRILERHGYTVFAASNGREALEKSAVVVGSPHLLLTDVVMPDMNGKELFEQLQRDHPQLRVLFMSGYTADVIAHHGVLEEGVAFIQKPFEVKALATKVRRILDRLE